MYRTKEQDRIHEQGGLIFCLLYEKTSIVEQIFCSLLEKVRAERARTPKTKKQKNALLHSGAKCLSRVKNS